MDEWRGDKGMRWTVDAVAGDPGAGAVGSAEVWLQAVDDGAVAHFFLRLDPRAGRDACGPDGSASELATATAGGPSVVFWALGDQLDPGRIARHLGSARHADRPVTSRMPDESTQSIMIDADPAPIMAVIADFPNYPLWTGSVKKAGVARARRPTAGPGASPSPSTPASCATSTSWPTSGPATTRRVGPRRGPDDARPARLVRAACSTDRAAPHVTYSLSVDLVIPMLGLLKRKAERVVMDTALKELKKRVEALRV